LTAAIITVDRLVKRYKHADRDAVDGISFSVRSGELFALLRYAVSQVAGTVLFVRREQNW
jgi:hypothetical protein